MLKFAKYNHLELCVLSYISFFYPSQELVQVVLYLDLNHPDPQVMDRKPEMVAALYPRVAGEASVQDVGDVPGDGLGAGG